MSYNFETRTYQQEVLEQARHENIIAFLDTGSGKTYIAMQLIKEIDGKCVFLAPMRNLVDQQFKVATYHMWIPSFIVTAGSTTGWTEVQWGNVFAKNKLLMMTPEIFKNALLHGYLNLESFKLLIFDECHHARKDHPYMLILKDFYHFLEYNERPKILGLTASPLIEGNLKVETLRSKVLEFCQTLDCKIGRIDLESLERIANKPTYYTVAIDDPKHSLQGTYERSSQSEGLLNERLSRLPGSEELAMVKNDLEKHYSVLLELLGPDGLNLYLTALSNRVENTGLREILSSSLQAENGVSNRVRKVVEIFASHFAKSQKQAIVLVERRITVWFLHLLFDRMAGEGLLPFTVGRIVGRSSSNSLLVRITDTQQRNIIKQFKAGDFKVLIATSIVEEGLDIPSCDMVLRFDTIANNLRSYVQSKGRARDQDSKFILLCNHNEEAEYKADLKRYEECITELKKLANLGLKFQRQDVFRLPCFKVPGTGARVSRDLAEKFLNEEVINKFNMYERKAYCANFNIVQCKPNQPTKSGVRNLVGGFECELKLPGLLRDPVYSSELYPNSKDANGDAAVAAVKELYHQGFLDDHLIPCYGERNRSNILDQRRNHEDIIEMPPKEQKEVHVPSNSIPVIKQERDYFLYGMKTLPLYPPNSVHTVGLLTTFKIPQHPVKVFPFNLFYYKGVELAHDHHQEVPECPRCEKYPVRLSFKLLKRQGYSIEELLNLKLFHCYLYSILSASHRSLYDEIRAGVFSPENDPDMEMSNCFIPILNNKIDWDLVHSVRAHISAEVSGNPPREIADPIGKLILTRNEMFYIVLTVYENGLDYEFEEYKQATGLTVWTVREYFSQKHNFSPKSGKVFSCYPIRGFRSMVLPNVSFRPSQFEELLLPAEFCREIPVPVELVLWGKLSPSIYYKIDQLRKLSQMREILHCELDFELLREALTTASANEDVNYE